MSLFVRSTRCRTGDNRSSRWVAVLAIFAMLGIAGIALADSGNNHFVKPRLNIHPTTKIDRVKMLDQGGITVPVVGSPGTTTPTAAPSNDDCTGALVIPGTGFPYVTTPEDVTDATPQDGSIDPANDCGGGAGGDHTVWYQITPAVTGVYKFNSCILSGATGSTLYDSVVSIVTSCASAPISCGDGGGGAGCSSGTVPPDLGGAPYIDQGAASAVLTAGQTYYVVAGDFVATPFDPPNAKVSLFVTFTPKPTNDDCSAPIPMALDKITFGNSEGAGNDYRSSNCAPVFDASTGQIFASGRGNEVVFSFTPPTNGKYSIRYVQDDTSSPLRAQNPVLYLADVCPAANPAGPVQIPGADCLAAANRMGDQTTGNGNRAEEINCVPLTAGTPYYLFFDDSGGGAVSGGNAGGPIALEVTKCNSETEPNDSIATATPYVPNSGCMMEGTTIPGDQSGDVDFFDIGAPPAGAKIFAALDTAASGISTYQMRITNATSTLGFDESDGTSWTGSGAPVIAGPIADGSELYARINSNGFCHYSGTGFPTPHPESANEPCQTAADCVLCQTISSGAFTSNSCEHSSCPTGQQCVSPSDAVCVHPAAGDGPYTLYTRVETGVPQPEGVPDNTTGGVPGNATNLGSPRMTNGGYVKGTMSASNDTDCWKFVAKPGDNIVAYTDNNPLRIPGTTGNTFPFIVTPEGTPPSNIALVGQVVRNVGMPGPGAGLTATTPTVTSEYIHYRARTAGAYFMCWSPVADVARANNPPAGAYPLPYQGSVSINCGPVPAPQPADVSVTKTGPAGPVNTGSILTYTITVTNNDPNVIVQDVELVDNMPPQVTLVNLLVDDGFGGTQTTCATLPTPGQNDAPIDCTNLAIAPGASVVYTLTVQVGNCIGAGLPISNVATITVPAGDPNPSNNSAHWDVTTSQDGSCQSLLCGPQGCIVDNCKVNQVCQAGVCGFDPRNCDDNSLCTADSCDPTNSAHPCVNDSTLLGDQCNDSNDCTFDGCDPVLFCVFPPKPSGTACDDFLTCTSNDVCDGAGGCFGHSVCDDGLPCTDDSADESNACACTNDISFPGTFCDDGNVCTTGTTCDGTGGTVAACNTTNGGTTINCNDNNPCTDDSCDPVLGCVHTNNTAACSDGNACTVGDTCGGGTCNSGAAAVCNDGNACNGVETCNPATGCVAGTPLVCNDGNACNGLETCNPATGCVAGVAPVCNDGNACNGVETCNPATGCVAGTPLVCNDGNACNGLETCNPATGCVAGTPLSCNDGNACNGVETCNPATGCVAGTPLSCNDGNACNGVETCNPATGCVAGTPLVCNDGNACNGVETCNPATGCVAGTPVVCHASDQCHDVGVCDHGTGTCSNPNKANGVACDDGNSGTTNDTCQAGICVGGSSCHIRPRPKSVGYYRNICDRHSHGHSHYQGDVITDADAVCVGNLTASFHGITVADQVCDVIELSHHRSPHGECNEGSACDKAEDELMALALNICRNRVCSDQEVDSECSGDHHHHTLTTVAASLATADAIVNNPNRTASTCSTARCLAREINNGHGVHHTSLLASRQTGNTLKLTWVDPIMDDGSGDASTYDIWRRARNTDDEFTQIGTTGNLFFTDVNAGAGEWEYTVTYTLQN